MPLTLIAGPPYYEFGIAGCVSAGLFGSCLYCRSSMLVQLGVADATCNFLIYGSIFSKQGRKSNASLIKKKESEEE